MKVSALKKLFISHRFDLLLAMAVIAIAVGALFIVKNSKKDGAYVEVKMGSKVVDTIPLDRDYEHTYESIFGSNKLIIKDGKAYVEYASCKDGICEKTGRISKVGETIICLPNELFIKIIGNGEGELDEIAQ